MAEKILNTRIQLKIDELSAWESSTIGLKKGEIAIATVSATAGKELAEPVIMMKVGEDGVKTFSQLPWALNAKASDVYSWAKQTSAQFADNFLAMVGADGTTMQAKLDTVFATDAALSTAVSNLQGELTTALANYYTKTEVDGLVAGAKTYAEEKASAAESAAKSYTDEEINKITTGAGYATTKYVDDAVAGHTSEVNTKFESYSTTAQMNEAIDADVLVETNRATAAEEALGERIDGVLGASTDPATANTVYGAKAAAAAAQSDATIAKTKIETFLGTITPDGSAEAIDTLAEIQKYMTDDTAAFTQLSTKVTNIENGTTATTADDLTAALEAEIKSYTVANATKAADADKLGGQDPSYYATAASVTDITKDGGAIDAALEAVTDTFGDIITHDASEFATAEQGAKADTALQSDDLGDGTLTIEVDGTTLQVLTERNEVDENNEISFSANAKDYTHKKIHIADKGITTQKLADGAVGAAQTKASVDYDGEDAEVWVFNCGSASEVI